MHHVLKCSRFRFVLVVAGCLAASDAPGQETPSFDASLSRDGKTSFVTWIDGIWVDHLIARAELHQTTPLLSEAYLRDALRVQPASPELVLALARFYHDNGITPLNEMMVAYGRRLDPSLTAWTTWPVAKEPETKEKPWDDALEKRYQEAASLFAAGKYLQSEVALRALLAEYPGDRRMMVDLGLLYIKTSDWGMAAAVLSLANERFPDNFDVANNLAVSCDQIRRPDLVPPVLEAQLAFRPDDVYLIQNICRYAMAGGDTNKALVFAERWTSLDTENPEARVSYARLLRLAGRNEDAMQQVKAALAADPKHAESIALMIEVQMAAGNLDEARRGLASLAEVLTAEQYQALVKQAPFNQLVETPVSGEAP